MNELGLAFASAITSFSVLAGTLGYIVITPGTMTIRDTGVKSRSVP